MANSRSADQRGWPGSGGRVFREEDARPRVADVSGEQEMKRTGDVRPQKPESSGQEAAAQDNQTPGEGEATVHQDERFPEDSAGPTGQAPPPRPRDPNLATPSISTAPSRIFMTFDSEGRPELLDLDELVRRYTPGSHPSMPDTEILYFSSESGSGREASVHDDLAPSGADLPSRHSYEAGSREASVPDDSAPPEASLSAGDCHEADSTEHIEGRSVSESPPTNSQNRQSPPPGRQGHDKAPVNQSTHPSSTPDSMAITPAPPLSSNDGVGSESDCSIVQGSHYGSVRSWNRTFDTFADQEDRTGRSDRSDPDSTAGPRQNPPGAARPRNLSSPDLPPADRGRFADIHGEDSHQLSTGGASSEQRTGGTDVSVPPEANPSTRHSRGEADSGEHVEGRSIPENPPTASGHQTKP